MKKQKKQNVEGGSKKNKISYFGQLQRQIALKSHKTRTLHVAWTNKQGHECKKIIEPNRCFCTHSFECHETPKTIGAAFCLSPGCKCKCYEYVPYYDIKCMCRHSYKEHDINSRMCKMCNKCLGFVTNWSCKCGMKYELHHTAFSMKQNTKEHDPSKSERFQHENSSMINSDADKQNYGKNLSAFFTKPVDSMTYELHKYDFQLKEYRSNERKMQDHKKRQIKRINEKYCNISYEGQVESYEDSLILEASRIYKPDQARSVTPLELFIRPHRYTPVKLQKFLQKYYKKYQTSSISQK